MKYEVVTLPPKTVIGITARTSNHAPDMGSVIGGLWHQFFGQGIYDSLADKVTASSLGLYSNYASDADGEYDITVCCETAEDTKLPEGTVKREIAAGRYAKFVLKNPDEDAVAVFWKALWQMPLNRTYKTDYEEYFQGASGRPDEIHVYIGIK